MSNTPALDPTDLDNFADDTEWSEALLAYVRKLETELSDARDELVAHAVKAVNDADAVAPGPDPRDEIIRNQTNALADVQARLHSIGLLTRF